MDITFTQLPGQPHDPKEISILVIIATVQSGGLSCTSSLLFAGIARIQSCLQGYLLTANPRPLDCLLEPHQDDWDRVVTWLHVAG